ncbi:lipocalin family protein [Dyadobacter sp. CY343]|uniref:lipocalin family protein n=1 Tax=Dyadobacter sp. CY343 TaxID=2907299 RepID=UPI001F38D1B7|nr:lipocalin family protein [Dyadobacter sp. CY343]MCE7058727.1 lipocalin family protein [Dyadobacter sp. CY343]
MKMLSLKKLTSLLLSIALLAGAVSCKKDKDDPTPGGNGNGVEGSWKLSAITVDPAQDGISDYLAYLEALTGTKCLSQTTFIFKGDGTVSGNVPAGCTVDESPVIEGDGGWKVVGNKIQMTDGTEVDEYDLEVKGNEMKWSDTVTEDGATYKMTLVFKKA